MSDPGTRTTGRSAGLAAPSQIARAMRLHDAQVVFKPGIFIYEWFLQYGGNLLFPLTLLNVILHGCIGARNRIPSSQIVADLFHGAHYVLFFYFRGTPGFSVTSVEFAVIELLFALRAAILAAKFALFSSAAYHRLDKVLVTDDVRTVLTKWLKPSRKALAREMERAIARSGPLFERQCIVFASEADREAALQVMSACLPSYNDLVLGSDTTPADHVDGRGTPLSHTVMFMQLCPPSLLSSPEPLEQNVSPHDPRQHGLAGAAPPPVPTPRATPTPRAAPTFWAAGHAPATRAEGVVPATRTPGLAGRPALPAKLLLWHILFKRRAVNNKLYFFDAFAYAVTVVVAAVPFAMRLVFPDLDAEWFLEPKTMSLLAVHSLLIFTFVPTVVFFILVGYVDATRRLECISDIHALLDANARGALHLHDAGDHGVDFFHAHESHLPPSAAGGASASDYSSPEPPTAEARVKARETTVSPAARATPSLAKLNRLRAYASAASDRVVGSAPPGTARSAGHVPLFDYHSPTFDALSARAAELAASRALGGSDTARRRLRLKEPMQHQHEGPPLPFGFAHEPFPPREDDMMRELLELNLTPEVRVDGRVHVGISQPPCTTPYGVDPPALTLPWASTTHPEDSVRSHIAGLATHPSVVHPTVAPAHHPARDDSARPPVALRVSTPRTPGRSLMGSYARGELVALFSLIPEQERNALLSSDECVVLPLLDPINIKSWAVLRRIVPDVGREYATRNSFFGFVFLIALSIGVLAQVWTISVQPKRTLGLVLLIVTSGLAVVIFGIGLGLQIVQGARANQLTYDQQMRLSVIASLAEQYLMGAVVELPPAIRTRLQLVCRVVPQVIHQLQLLDIVEPQIAMYFPARFGLFGLIAPIASSIFVLVLNALRVLA